MRTESAIAEPTAARSSERKRLNAYINAEQHDKLQATFSRYGLKMSEGLRIGANVFAAALPVLAKGGEIIFRDPDGAERSYMFPFFAP